MATKETTKPARKAPAKSAKVGSASGGKVAAKVVHKEEKPKAAAKPAAQKPAKADGKYIFATGRRKTAVANVRLFGGAGDSQVNKKAFEVYFGQASLRDKAVRPLALSGLIGDYYFTATVNGGGINAQAEAVRHGIAQALASMNDDIKKVLKKNGFLTRDPREKERKKPGLRRARRSPQWAKR